MSDPMKCEKCGVEGRRRLYAFTPEGWLFMEALLDSEDPQSGVLVIPVCSEACARGLWENGPGNMRRLLPHPPEHGPPVRSELAATRQHAAQLEQDVAGHLNRIAELKETVVSLQGSHTQLMAVSGALCDAGNVVVEPYADAVRELTRQRDKAVAERDRAVTALRAYHRLPHLALGSGGSTVPWARALDAFEQECDAVIALADAKKPRLACSRCGAEVSCDYEPGECRVDDEGPSEGGGTKLDHDQAEPWAVVNGTADAEKKEADRG